MKYFFFICVLFLSGCAATYNPIPEGYTGSIATVDDSFKILSSRTAEMFFIQKVDGKGVMNTFDKSYDASYGKNGILITEGFSHQLPVKKNRLLLSGETVHGAPIGYILNAGSNYMVRGEVEFMPEAGQYYLISGSLSKERSAVWIENLKGDIVSDVVLVIGDSKKSTVIPSSQYIMDNRSHDSRNEKQDKTVLFSNISGGESLALVTEKIGEPDSTTYNKANFFTQRPASIDYKYRGLGVIRFTSHEKKAGSVLRVFPEINKDNESLAAQLDSSGLTLQHVAKEYFKKDNLSEAELDKVEKTIWKNRNAEDDYTKDAVAWLIKVIGKQGDSRYYSLINTLTDKDRYDSKITRYANKALKVIEPSSTNQFYFSD